MKRKKALSRPGSRGVTLIELLVVISIIVILIAALGFGYKGWEGRFNSEGDMRQMQADLLKARSDAMGRQRDFFVQFTCDAGTKECSSYSVYEDNSPTKDGDGTLQVGADTLVPGYPRTLRYPVTWWANGAGAAAVVPAMITFDNRGNITTSTNTTSQSVSSSVYGTIVMADSLQAATTRNPDYDCIDLTALKINMGQWSIGGTNPNTCTIK